MAILHQCSQLTLKLTLFLLHLKALLGVLLPLFGQDDDVLPDGGEPLLKQLDHSSLLPQVLQLLGIAGETTKSWA